MCVDDLELERPRDTDLRMLSIHKVGKTFDEDSDMGKKVINAIELNEIAQSELLFSIDAKTGNGKIAVNIVKGCESKDHPGDNAANTWEKPKNKYEPISGPSMVNLGKQFTESFSRKLRILTFLLHSQKTFVLDLKIWVLVFQKGNL
jgi:hypothetical protein